VLAGELLAATAGRAALIVTHRPEQTPGLGEVRLGKNGTFDPAPLACVGGSSTIGRTERGTL
jgi:ATP-binding cassette, subfamily C, bacterial CydCD